MDIRKYCVMRDAGNAVKKSTKSVDLEVHDSQSGLVTLSKPLGASICEENAGLLEVDVIVPGPCPPRPDAAFKIGKLGNVKESPYFAKKCSNRPIEDGHLEDGVTEVRMHQWGYP